MEALWWFLTLGLMVIGLVGTVVPLVPGTVLILCAVLNHFLLHSDRLADSTGPYAHDDGGASPRHCEWVTRRKVVGATRWGAIGGILGQSSGYSLALSGSLLDH